MQKKFHDAPYALYTQAIKNLHIPVRLDQSSSPSHGFLAFFYWYCTKIPSFFWRHNLAKWNTKKTLFRHRIIVPFTIVFDAGGCHSCASLLDIGRENCQHPQGTSVLSVCYIKYSTNQIFLKHFSPANFLFSCKFPAFFLFVRTEPICPKKIFHLRIRF